jgi:predicted RNA-binding protein with PIN domain
MSLLYIIDGYNIISHTRFPRTNKNTKDPRRALLGLIKTKRLAGSFRNKVIVVFDGYPNLSDPKEETDIDVVFSRKETADDRIKRIVETQGNPRNVVVVSDDKEIRVFIKAAGARSMGVEEFIQPVSQHGNDINRKKKLQEERALIKTELSYSQMDKINQELKAIWLKD